jgi:hypothetical protein
LHLFGNNVYNVSTLRILSAGKVIYQDRRACHVNLMSVDVEKASYRAGLEYKVEIGMNTNGTAIKLVSVTRRSNRSDVLVL